MLSVMKLSALNAECHIFNVVLSVVMLSVVMLSVVMLSVVMLSAVKRNVAMLLSSQFLLLCFVRNKIDST